MKLPLVLSSVGSEHLPYKQGSLVRIQYRPPENESSTQRVGLFLWNRAKLDQFNQLNHNIKDVIAPIWIHYKTTNRDHSAAHSIKVKFLRL